MMMIEARLLAWLKRRSEDHLLRQYGGTQTCPWCRQTAQSGDGWHFQEWPRDPFLDVLTCGVCGGTSLWRFEMLMIYIGALDPPSPAHSPAPYYDIANAKLRPVETRNA